MLVHHQGQCVVLEVVLRVALVDAVQPQAQLAQTFGRVIAFVDHIVGHATKRVQGDGRRAHPWRQQFARREEAFRAAAHQRHAGIEVVLRA